MRALAIALAAALTLPGAASAQEETLADIRQELSVLFGELQRLQVELNTTGSPQVDLSGTSALERIDVMEAELRRLTGATEAAQNRIASVVADGTNRIGDLEFRLCEVEPGCDIAALGDTPTLGGGAGAAPVAVVPPAANPGGAQLAIGEQADFDRAKEAFDSSSFRSAADLFATFAQTYTGGPLTGEAHFYRGRALEELDETENAARAYLDSYSGSPQGALAPDALLRLALALDAVGQRDDACANLDAVTQRYPDTNASIEAQTARASLGCT